MGSFKSAWKDFGKREIEPGMFVGTAELDDENF